MRKLNSTTIALAIFIAFGAIYGLITNIFLDELIEAVWTPLAIALYFFVFAVLLCVLTMVVVRAMGNIIDRQILVKEMVIVLVVVFIATMLFEVLYEIDTKVEIKEPDSYIVLLDDSSSMEGSDPNNERLDAVKELVSDKHSSFPYAIYTFANDVHMVRDMLPKSDGFGSVELSTDGGTAMYSSLQRVIDDISTGKLRVTQATRVLLLSDGMAGDEPISKSKLLKEFVNRNLVVSTIGLGDGVDVSAMERIASYTGGVYVHVNNASELDSAMIDAAIQTAPRHLLGYRGFCRTNTLHAVLRVAFLLMIIGLIFIVKIYSYGKYYTPNMVVGIVAGVAAALLPEIGLELLFLNADAVRVAMCILMAVTIVERILRNPPREREKEETESAPRSEIKLSEIDSLSETNK